MSTCVNVSFPVPPLESSTPSLLLRKPWTLFLSWLSTWICPLYRSSDRHLRLNMRHFFFFWACLIKCVSPSPIFLLISVTFSGDFLPVALLLFELFCTCLPFGVSFVAGGLFSFGFLWVLGVSVFGWLDSPCKLLFGKAFVILALLLLFALSWAQYSKTFVFKTFLSRKDGARSGILTSPRWNCSRL